MKKCFKCNRSKPVSMFYKHSGMKDGLLGKCKLCAKKDTKKRYYNNPISVTEYERKRRSTEERRAKMIEYQRVHRKNNPGKYRARGKVNHLIERGKLKKSPCEICGSLKVEAHHPDYRRPLSIKWLCPQHHRQEK